MSHFIMQMGPGRAFVEGDVLERVDRYGCTLVQCNGTKVQLQFETPASLLAGQLIQAYGPFEPETEDEYALLNVEKFGVFPLGWVNGR